MHFQRAQRGGSYCHETSLVIVPITCPWISTERSTWVFGQWLGILGVIQLFGRYTPPSPFTGGSAGLWVTVQCPSKNVLVYSSELWHMRPPLCSILLSQWIPHSVHSYFLPASSQHLFPCAVTHMSVFTIKKSDIEITESLSRVWLFVTTWTVVLQVPLSMEFFRQEYWSVLPFSLSGGLPSPGAEPESPALAGRFFTSEPLGKFKLTETRAYIYFLCMPWT